METEDKSNIKIVRSHALESPALIAFLNSHCIDENVAKKHCEEVDFEVDNKRDKAVSFKNDTSGFVLEMLTLKQPQELNSPLLFVVQKL